MVIYYPDQLNLQILRNVDFSEHIFKFFNQYFGRLIKYGQLVPGCQKIHFKNNV